MPDMVLSIVQLGLEVQPTSTAKLQLKLTKAVINHHPMTPRDTAGLSMATGHQRCHMSGDLQSPGKVWLWWDGDGEAILPSDTFMPKEYITRQRVRSVSVVASCMKFILLCGFSEHKTNFKAGYAKFCHQPVIAQANFSKEMLRFLPKHLYSLPHLQALQKQSTGETARGPSPRELGHDSLFLFLFNHL